MKARESERESERDGAGERAARLIPLLSQHPFCSTLFQRGERYIIDKFEEGKGEEFIQEGGYRGKWHIIRAYRHPISPLLAVAGWLKVSIQGDVLPLLWG